jgi:acetylornithine deacetylase
LFPLDAIALTEALVAIDSRNPSLVVDGPGEMACAQFLAGVLSGWGFAVSLDEVAPGRPNVVARIGPTGRSPLVLNGHLDVVGTDGICTRRSRRKPAAATSTAGAPPT